MREQDTFGNPYCFVMVTTQKKFQDITDFFLLM